MLIIRRRVRHGSGLESDLDPDIIKQNISYQTADTMGNVV